MILAAIWSDEWYANLPLSDLKEQFPKIVALYEVSNKTGKGIEDLQQAITRAAAELLLMSEI
ncbi:MAG: hypothetical protein AAGF01_20635 [Cyanobacteria bacterium P01_G01_bin.38]